MLYVPKVEQMCVLSPQPGSRRPLRASVTRRALLVPFWGGVSGRPGAPRVPLLAGLLSSFKLGVCSVESRSWD